MNITSGKKPVPYRVVLYGTEGIGKSTAASEFPAPVFIDTEGSTERMDVQRFATPKTLDDVEADIEQLRTESHDFKTLVIDTFDKLELMINDKVCEENHVTGIESIGYGKGYTYVAEKVNKLLGKLDTLRNEKGMHIVIVCHAQLRKIEQPEEMGAYDHWELKLSKKAAPMLKEWCDLLLFANYKTYVVKTDNGSRKAQGGKRMMYTTHTPAWDAKNRDGLPEEMTLDYKNISHLFEGENTGKTEGKTEAKTEVQSVLPAEVVDVPEGEDEELPFPMNDTEAKLRELMKKAKVTEDEVIFTFHEKGKFTNIEKLHDIDDWGFIEKSVIGQWVGFMKAVEKYGKDCPFCAHIEEKKGGKR